MSLHHKVRWVKDQYLSDKKSTSRSSGSRSGGGISRAPCPSGSFAASGLTPDAICVHCAVCQRYPQVIITGWDIAHWVRANVKSLGVSKVRYRQHLWPVERSSEGWRSTSDRDSPTATNHMDYIHVSIYGNSGPAPSRRSRTPVSRQTKTETP